MVAFDRSAYEQSIFCEVFHAEESGWRECNSCDKVKKIHGLLVFCAQHIQIVFFLIRIRVFSASSLWMHCFQIYDGAFR